jgi:putative glutathione S-transferase
VGTAGPIRPEKERSDWEFYLDPGGLDPVLKVRYLSELYLAADSSYAGRFTVPAIVDIAAGKVVNNDYINMSYYWEKDWKAFHSAGAPDLLPENLEEEIFELNDIIFRELNNGVYEAGFARNQEAYEEAFYKVFRRLDLLESRLEKDPFLFGTALTDADIRLYVTLIRFDAAYYNCFRLNKKRIRDYPALWAYVRRLYSIPAFRDNTDFEHIKIHYHLCCDPGNVFRLVPKGPDVNDLNSV